MHTAKKWAEMVKERQKSNLLKEQELGRSYLDLHSDGNAANETFIRLTSH